MLAVATSFFSRTAISQAYTIGAASTSISNNSSGSRTASPSPNVVTAAPVPFTPSFNVGLWRVQSATHKTTNKRVSVWSFDKRNSEMERMGLPGRERTLEVLKAEASALGRLRHPSILEMAEPLEETRGELIFATEPLLSSLELSIPGSSRKSPLVELDEIEIQKGILQICKGLSFLHTSAKLIHSNISPESIVVNSAGDWKISGLGLTIPLLSLDGKATRWEFPTFDGRVPAYTQRSFDYMAPEYALDEQLLTASDMYSLGCVIYAVHFKGSPPFKTHGSLSGLRDNAGRTPPNMDRLDVDLRGFLGSLITRHPTNRPTPATLPTHSFFNSLPISTLNFLDRSNFTSKTREEKISFMKGLGSVLDKFSEGLRTRKILPSLLEEMKDSNLLPYILPNVFAISNILTASQFASLVLPSLKPLFAVKEPPQNMLTLLDNLQMLQSKTDKTIFREQVLCLVYNALESEHTMVQERALKVVPDLCETIDYAEILGILFPCVALVFTRTRILSVKVATLVTFLEMVKTLDQTTLTQKLVPLLSKIRTKEPAVMVATLAVQEAMGFKVDREAVATLVLPQLWAMSMGPLLNLDQFQRFMLVIRKLGERVEKEHNQFLRDSQRIEDRSATAVNADNTTSFTATVNFETLVGGATVKADTTSATSDGWDDDVWGTILSSNTQASDNFVTNSQTQSLPSSPKWPSPDPPLRPSKLGAQRHTSSNVQTRGNASGTHFTTLSTSTPFAPLAPTSIPNYNITPSATQPISSTFSQVPNPRPFPNPAVSQFRSPQQVPPPSMTSVLTPTNARPVQPNPGPMKLTKSDPAWAVFDPLA